MIRQNVCHSLAYRSIAACSIDESSPASRALTVTTTNDRQNMMWATRIDQKPSVPARPALVNRASSEEPITTSGVAIGRKISRLVAARPRNRCRTSANATSVPSRVAPTVARNPICRLLTTAPHMPLGSQGSVQFASVNPSNSYDSRLAGSLNDISTTKKIGRNM